MTDALQCPFQASLAVKPRRGRAEYKAQVPLGASLAQSPALPGLDRRIKPVRPVGLHLGLLRPKWSPVARSELVQLLFLGGPEVDSLKPWTCFICAVATTRLQSILLVLLWAALWLPEVTRNIISR